MSEPETFPGPQLPDFREGVLRLVVGFDGSPASSHALCYAAGIARRNRDVRLIVAFISVPHAGQFAPQATAATLQAEIAAARHLRGEAAEYLAALEGRWVFVHRSGSPAREIARLAKEVQADAIVVGRSTPAWHRLRGSVPVHLVKRGCAPVIVVP